MTYILCEDKEMGYKLWSCLVYYIFGESAVIFKGCGIDGIRRTLNYLLGDTGLTLRDTILNRKIRLTSGDIVILALDNIITSEYDNKSNIMGWSKVQSVLRSAKSVINLYDCKVIWTTFYCLEEGFLYSRLLTDWVDMPKSSKILYDILFRNKPVGSYMMQYESEIREHVAKKLLTTFTHNLTSFAQFEVTERKLGYCWLSDCRSPRKNLLCEGIRNVKSCKLHSKLYTSRMKAYMLFKYLLGNNLACRDKTSTVQITYRDLYSLVKRGSR